ncbi:MAG: succinate dehydrogenase/fumarate reductase iron-sulfur subunit [bacterium]
MSEETIQIEVFRYLPDQGDEPSFQTYAVPFREDWVVLDALNYIKDELDGSLSYRWSCRMGVCGSCGVMVDGVPKLTCGTFLKDYYPNPIRVEPLEGFPVVRDLVNFMDDFMEKLKSVQPWLIRSEGEEKAIDEGEYRQTPAELSLYKRYSMCINCLLCYAACPITALEPAFVGPAAIALAQRYNMDSRDQGHDQRQDVIMQHNGIWDCTFVGECSQVCPKDVDPAGAIQRAKLKGTVDWFKQWVLPSKGGAAH